MNILSHANVGKNHAQDAETTPLRDPEHYQYDFNLADVAEVWRRGSVVASWLLDLTASALAKEPELANFSGSVSDSGEGRWTILAAIDEGAPSPVLSAALYDRFTSRGEGDFAHKLLSAMRFEFGGPCRAQKGISGMKPKRKILVIDIGGTHVKLLATGQKVKREFASGPKMGPVDMARQVKDSVKDWDYDVISMGYPGPVVHGRPLARAA